MPAFIRYITLLPAALSLIAPATASAGTFGTVVPIRGQLSDIAIDRYRGVIYAANFPANRVEVINQQSLALGTSIPVNYPPSSIALSPDGTYLVIGQYVDIATTATQTSAVNSLTIVNLVTNQTQSLSLGTASVLTVAFGNSPKALMVLSNGVSLLDPAKGVIQPLAASGSTTVPTPVPWATTSPSIIKASSGISGDGNVLVSLIDGPPQSLVVRYQIDVGGLNITSIVSSPTLGPRVVSVDRTGAHSLDAWGLDSFVNGSLYTAGQFPYATGNLNVGTHAWDSARNYIYAQMSPGTDQTPGATSTGTAPLLQIFDSDNLTVEETLQLRENLTGKSLLNGDTMYSISESGMTVLPVGTLAQSHRVVSAQEDVYIQAGGCDQRPVTQSFGIIDPGGGATDFTLSVNSPGVTVYPLSGTTPAQIQVTVDPTQFQSNKGTAVIPMQLSSVLGVNLPKSVRLLVNTNDPNQQGTIYNIPGTLVDVLADPIYDRFYVLRQDMNEVLVFDGTSLAQIAALRTGTTPIQMAIAYGELLVTADNTQYLNVFDLATLTPRAPVYLPSGQYGRSIAASNSHILLTSRSAAGTPELIGVDLTINSAAPLSGGIFTTIIDPGAVLASSPSGNTIYMAMPDGTVALFDDLAGKFLASRKDLSSLSGAYSALSDDLFIAGANVIDAGLVPISQIDLLGGAASGVAMNNGLGLLTTTPAAARNGLIERFDTSTSGSIAPTLLPESPLTAAAMTKTPVGQVGQTILPFTRTLAPLANGNGYIQLSTSGFSFMPATFDVPQSTPVISSMTNAADGGSTVAPGGLVSLWGSGLTAANAAASTVPLPKGLGGVCLYLGSTPLPLFFVSPSQINTQLPFNLAQGASLVVRSVTGQSAPFGIPAQPSAPAIFRTSAGGPMIIRTVDGKYITNSTPIHLNESLIIYMTGLGAVSAPPAAGSPSPSSPVATTVSTPAITIGGKSIWTTFSGLAPGLVGVNQVNALVPFNGIPTGSNIPFKVTQNGVSTTVYLQVDGP